MNTAEPKKSSHSRSRRDFLKCSGTATAVSALTGMAVPQVHPTGKATIKLALVGCGGRGTGAVGVGFMWRHSQARQEVIQRIHDGAIGDMHTLRIYRVQRDLSGPATWPDERSVDGALS